MASPSPRLLAVTLALGLLIARTTFAQGTSTPNWTQLGPPRSATLAWQSAGRELVASFDFSDLIDDGIRQKLRRGLPTRILLTALTFRPPSKDPVASTYQSCKVTWHVWEEMYQVELTQPSASMTRRHWTPTLEGVLRRCAAANQLLVADSSAVSPGETVYLESVVRINPLDEALMNKLRQWVTRPSRTTTAAPGSALFSTFTGLFMQRIGDAEKTLRFRTRPTVPAILVASPPP